MVRRRGASRCDGKRSVTATLKAVAPGRSHRSPLRVRETRFGTASGGGRFPRLCFGHASLHGASPGSPGTRVVRLSHRSRSAGASGAEVVGRPPAGAEWLTIHSRHGLPYVAASLLHNGRRLLLEDASCWTPARSSFSPNGWTACPSGPSSRWLRDRGHRGGGLPRSRRGGRGSGAVGGPSGGGECLTASDEDPSTGAESS